jgi:hypothetical protein
MLIPILCAVYAVTVVVSFGILFIEWLDYRKRYPYTTKEIVVGLIIVPLIPVVNLIVAYFHL